MTKRIQMSKGDARKLAINAGIDLNDDFHQLRSSEVDKILAIRKLHGYRKPQNAPGSTARMFFYYMQKGFTRDYSSKKR